jgi:hypothetical protein
MFIRLKTLLTGLILFTSLSCDKAADATTPVNKPKPRDEAAIKAKFGIPVYFNFIETLKKEGFVFWDFDKFHKSDKSKLPEKLIVIRHDIHSRDINGGVNANKVEKYFIGSRAATYFVMYNDPNEEYDSGLQQQYLKFIASLNQDTVDVQPHISANDLYIANNNPSWKYKDISELKELFEKYYEIKKTIDNHGLGTEIIVKSVDTLHLKQMNTKLLEVLKAYNAKWERDTGLKVRYYASHGSKVNMNMVLNNAVILDQLSLLRSGVYEFDTYNSWIAEHLIYLSDNSIPSWIGKPLEVKPGRYQLLMHPWVWENYTMPSGTANSFTSSFHTQNNNYTNKFKKKVGYVR